MMSENISFLLIQFHNAGADGGLYKDRRVRESGLPSVLACRAGAAEVRGYVITLQVAAQNRLRLLQPGEHAGAVGLCTGDFNKIRSDIFGRLPILFIGRPNFIRAPHPPFHGVECILCVLEPNALVIFCAHGFGPPILAMMALAASTRERQ
ncbi:hypothetical protein Xaut_3668 [Xanthobacter versatilis]|uniref:Uncharacterized protein n=1 Tax=Xanthobacter autotrophicus (strain ATCC BAA-1158 / Py2) TaxID=78245 RepID=A7ILK3_XANP2|nr:hypothetical protein Xaut_3668 [Xanthobacter autotrophicus Py2]